MSSTSISPHLALKLRGSRTSCRTSLLVRVSREIHHGLCFFGCQKLATIFGDASRERARGRDTEKASLAFGAARSHTVGHLAGDDQEEGLIEYPCLMLVVLALNLRGDRTSCRTPSLVRDLLSLAIHHGLDLFLCCQKLATRVGNASHHTHPPSPHTYLISDNILTRWFL